MRLTLSKVVTAAGLALAAGIVIVSLVGGKTLQTLKINGPIYRQIVDSKDLVADILPPPLYLIETYALLNEAVTQPETAEGNMARLAVLKKQYEERRDYWKTSTLPDNLRTQLYNAVIAKGDLVWQAIEREYVPALKGGNQQAIDTALDTIKVRFHDHEKAVNDLVDMANVYGQQMESFSAAQTASGEFLSLALAVVLVATALGTVFFIRRRALNPLGNITEFMVQMAQGDFSKAAPFLNRSDEIGRIAQAVEVFRAAGLENQRLQLDAEAARAEADAERNRRERNRTIEAEALRGVVEALGSGLRRLAECNISATLNTPFDDRFETLRQDFNSSIATFQQTLHQVLNETQHLVENSQEIHQASYNLAVRTEQQAAAIEETSAALEQVTSTVRNSSEKAHATRQLVREARECAVASGEVVRNAVLAMDRIEGASGEIGKIITVIDDIAFQTNLLALNAGVEAARAGEAGKGFAVVAQEVRELAQRSANAAREIDALIQRTSAEVSSGVTLVDRTGQALSQIGSFVERIDVNIDAVATASREQASGLDEISNAIQSFEKMTQQNAAMVEETSAISQTLAEGAQNLRGLVNRFQFNSQTQVSRRGTSRAA
ncbi:methyl-accepting chemotaxis protein [Rhizobium oryzicola]|uniref:HAMP domain-containing methyl-accepting chemotaxis protein n=1 Tax=Rhizobium oryzicola TaxID=1232668 RepID=A0ABT8SU95_9HYPH|nr:HAMP domain-containing methyl-accepting chemotaxis protein [Rhizobium oryzicola]MDO1581921.1 HAMP domain-containing methyl-accepting chemotaxis protein [Rhizobium oryzicola]